MKELFFIGYFEGESSRERTGVWPSPPTCRQETIILASIGVPPCWWAKLDSSETMGQSWNPVRVLKGGRGELKLPTSLGCIKIIKKRVRRAVAWVALPVSGSKTKG